MQKNICVLIMAVFCTIFCVSCKGLATSQQISEDDARQIADGILPKAEEIALWYYNSPPGGEKEYGDKYIIADIDGIENTDDLKKATRSVFSEEYCEKHFFKEIGDLSEEKGFTDIYGKLYFIPRDCPSEYTWLTDTLEIVQQSDDMLLLRMEYQVKVSGMLYTDSGDLRLIYENNSWHIDSPIYSTGNKEGKNKILNQRELYAEKIPSSDSNQKYELEDITAFFEQNRETFEEIKDRLITYDKEVVITYKRNKIVIEKEVKANWSKSEKISDKTLEKLLKKYYSVEAPINISKSDYSNSISSVQRGEQYKFIGFDFEDSINYQSIYYYEGEMNDIIKEFSGNVKQLDDNWYLWGYGQM